MTFEMRRFFNMTEEWLDILDANDDLIAMILQSEIVVQYRDAKKEVYQHPGLFDQMVTFNQMKERYDEVQRFGKYHPDYRTVMKEIRLLKKELDLSEKVAAYRLAENELQHLLDEIGYTLAQHISQAITVDTSNPFFITEGCGSGCGTGGSCSCSA